MKKVLFICHGNICRSPMAEFVMKDLAAKAGLSDKFEIASAATSTEEIKKPYVEETIKELKRRGYQTAVVTATAEDRAVRYLEMVGFKELFDEIISASMVKLGKPRPDVYLYACEKIGRKPEECMAVEDSPNGVNAAYQAGCHVTMVPDLTPADEEVKKMADHVVPDLRGLLEYLK